MATHSKISPILLHIINNLYIVIRTIFTDVIRMQYSRKNISIIVAYFGRTAQNP
jgi:hypothetical protein